MAEEGNAPNVFTSLEQWTESMRTVLGMVDDSIKKHRDAHPDHACESMYEEFLLLIGSMAEAAGINYAEMLNRLMLYRIGKRQSQARMN